MGQNPHTGQRGRRGGRANATLPDRINCFTLYLFECKSLGEVAQLTGYGLSTLKTWASRGKWADIKSRMEERVAEAVTRHLVSKVSDSLDTVNTSHLTLHKKMVERMELLLAQCTSPKDLKDFAGAMKVVLEHGRMVHGETPAPTPARADVQRPHTTPGVTRHAELMNAVPVQPLRLSPSMVEQLRE